MPRPSGYTHAVATGSTVWLAGQIGCGSDGRIVSVGDLSRQFEQALRNIATVLDAAGCRPADIVKMTIYVTDVAAYRAALGPIGRAYREVLGKHYPAMTLVEVSALFDKEALVEIECVAVRGS